MCIQTSPQQMMSLVGQQEGIRLVKSYAATIPKSLFWGIWYRPKVNLEDLAA